jgi:hypothetical protein
MGAAESSDKDVLPADRGPAILAKTVKIDKFLHV